MEEGIRVVIVGPLEEKFSPKVVNRRGRKKEKIRPSISPSAQLGMSGKVVSSKKGSVIDPEEIVVVRLDGEDRNRNFKVKDLQKE